MNAYKANLKPIDYQFMDPQTIRALELENQLELQKERRFRDKARRKKWRAKVRAERIIKWKKSGRRKKKKKLNSMDNLFKRKNKMMNID